MASKSRKIASIGAHKLASVHERSSEGLYERSKKPLYDHSHHIASIGYGKKKRANA